MFRAFLLLVLIVASVSGGVTVKRSSWIVVPGADGEIHLDLLREGHRPQPREINGYEDIQFLVFSRSNPDTPVRAFVDDMNGAPFDPSKCTRFIIHGFSGSFYTKWNGVDLKNAHLRVEDCNVIGVDWSVQANNPSYIITRDLVKPVGEYLAKMIDYLASLGAETSSMHLIGHSLGSHVSGYAGKAVTSGRLGRISGIDPALPLFNIEEPEERLDSGDAIFVDIIHSCAGWLGFDAAIGHADFYPNSGNNQPGCGWDLTGSCSHRRSTEFYLESIESSSFLSVECASWEDFKAGLCTGESVPMGFPLDPSTRGNFYLATASDSPFALG